MKKSYLPAKISQPRLSEAFARKRLFKLLDGGRKKPVTWISGPAGSGKTTLIASYLDARDLPCIWYSVDGGDADIASFFYYLGLAAKQATPRFRKPLPLLTPEYLLGIPAFTRGFFEDLYSRLKSPFTIVFDNYQDAPGESALHEIIATGLSFAPVGVRAFVVSRNELRPAFARLRANEAIHLVGWNDLRFTADESKQLIQRREKRRLLKSEIEELHTRADGWAAGLVLMLEMLKVDADGSGTPVAQAPKEIFEYFAGEVLDKLDSGTRDFLLLTSFLPKMTAKAAESLTGRKNAHALLSRLTGGNFFTEKLSGPEPVIRYHPLFREFLQERATSALGREGVVRVQKRAAELLLSEGQIEDAASLLVEAEDWNGLVPLILGNAQSLVAQGRSGMLEKWLGSVPRTMAENVPWLLFWRGVCRLPVNAAESRSFFERAFQLFQTQNDDAGALMTWSGAVDTFMFEWNGFALLDSWIDWMDSAVREGRSIPSAEIESRVASCMTGALLFRRPDHPAIENWIDRALHAARSTEDLDARFQACFYAFNYYLWMGDIAHSSLMIEEIKKITRASGSSPLLSITVGAIEALQCTWSAADHEAALRLVSEGLETAGKSGVHTWDHLLYALGVYASLGQEDMTAAADFLRRMEPLVKIAKGLGLCHYHQLMSWYHQLLMDAPRAVVHAETALHVALQTECPLLVTFSRLVCAEALRAHGRHREALNQLNNAGPMIHGTQSRMLEFMHRVSDTALLLDGGDERAGMESLRKAMELGREQGYVNMLWRWHPAVMTGLCERALRAGIEIAYAVKLVRIRRFVPETSARQLEAWPWPFKVRTLGRFSLDRDGKHMHATGKVQKPLALLKALIALGGEDVPKDTLTDFLWPDAEGDAAQSAFTTTLGRLRSLLGNEKAVSMTDGKASLDPRLWWVDARAFERMYEEAEAEWKGNGGAGDPAAGLARAERAFSLYGGHFLPGESAHWAISTRERLRNKYIRLMGRAGAYYEDMREWEQAAAHYSKALETDDLVEEFYQRLMVCYDRLGHRAEALKTYQRCAAVLHASFGVIPSAVTRSLQEKISKE